MGIIYGKELNLSKVRFHAWEGTSQQKPIFLSPNLSIIQPYHGMIDGVIQFSNWPCHCIMMSGVQFIPTRRESVFYLVLKRRIDSNVGNFLKYLRFTFRSLWPFCLLASKRSLFFFIPASQPQISLPFHTFSYPHSQWKHTHMQSPLRKFSPWVIF